MRSYLSEDLAAFLASEIYEGDATPSHFRSVVDQSIAIERISLRVDLWSKNRGGPELTLAIYYDTHKTTPAWFAAFGPESDSLDTFVDWNDSSQSMYEAVARAAKRAVANFGPKRER